MLMSYEGSFLPPGALPPWEVVFDELTSIIWGRLEHQTYQAYTPIGGPSRDAGNVPTTVLRSGLLLTKAADGLSFLPWGSVTDLDTDLIQGILCSTIQTQRMGVDQDRHMGYVLVGGNVKVNGLIVPGEADSGILGHAQEGNIRYQLRHAFKFDDDPIGHLAVAPI